MNITRPKTVHCLKMKRGALPALLTLGHMQSDNMASECLI